MTRIYMWQQIQARVFAVFPLIVFEDTSIDAVLFRGRGPFLYDCSSRTIMKSSGSVCASWFQTGRIGKSAAKQETELRP